MKEEKHYEAPEAEQIVIRYENNIMSDPDPGEGESGDGGWH